MPDLVPTVTNNILHRAENFHPLRGLQMVLNDIRGTIRVPCFLNGCKLLTLKANKVFQA